MRRDRLRWTAWGIAILTFLLTLAAPASAQSAQSNAGQPAPNQQDISDLQRAREYITRNQLDEAKGICDRLANKGGTVGAQAQDCLTQVNARSACEQDAQRLLDLSKQRVCQQAAELLQAIRQRCPDFTGLLTLDATVTRCVPLPPPPSSPVLQAGIELYNNRQYRQALSFFESKRSTDPNLPELEGWIEKTKEQLKTARQKLATEEGRVSKPGSKPTPPSTSQEGDQAQRALLAEAVGEYYAGHLSRADQLLEQYGAQPGGDQALAYFFRGAIACTRYFLTGAKDDQTAARAREYFSKARQADAQFTPPGDYISPKIIEIYQQAAAGS